MTRSCEQSPSVAVPLCLRLQQGQRGAARGRCLSASDEGERTPPDQPVKVPLPVVIAWQLALGDTPQAVEQAQQLCVLRTDRPLKLAAQALGDRRAGGAGAGGGPSLS